jgi:MFS family permease
MRGVSFKAVAIALVATLGLDIVVGMVLTSVLGGSQLPGPEATEQQVREAMLALTKTPAFLGWSAVLGTLTTVLGGYLAARMADQVPYMNALAFGIAGMLVGLLSAHTVPPWFSVLGLVLTVPAALLGGNIAKRQRRGAA